MPNYLVNGLYPLEYFVQAGVDKIQYPHEFWWQSHMRYASEGERGQYNKNGNNTAEYLEIDLSRIRQVNYINFSVLRAPINITVEYDALSDVDSNHQWVEVTPVHDEAFDDRIHYSSKHRSAWQDAEFYFTDSQGHAINTRFIRIKFLRRDVDWPHDNAKPFRWSVMVRNLRPARFINKYVDTRGTLFDSGMPEHTISPEDELNINDPNHVLMGISDTLYSRDDVTETDWVKQQIGLPFDTVRGTTSPSLMGFSTLFWVEPNAPTPEFDAIPNETLVRIQWKVFDVTNRAAAPVLLKSGIESGALTDKHAWVNVYFDPEDVIDTALPDVSPVYEIWVKSLAVHADAGDGLGVRQILGKIVHQDRATSGQCLFGGTATNGANTIVMDSTAHAGLVQNGDLIQRIDRVDPPALVSSVTTNTIHLASVYPGESVTTQWERVLPLVIGTSASDYTKSTVMRVWADIGDDGRDVLGNTYRYATQHDKPEQVLDASQVGWMSEPQPSPNAVEALYFDTRFSDINGDTQPSVIDAIRVHPRTPGILMHIYYTENHGDSVTPQNGRQWDRLIWNPVHTTYVIDGASTYTLPTPIRAAFVKLEFTKLQPRPIHVPARPDPPYAEYRRYPTWIETQFDNSVVRRTVEDWYHDAVKRGLVRIDALEFMRDPVLEFQHKEREFLSALATDKRFDTDERNSGLINVRTNTFIDPTTASKINVNTNRMYGSPLTLLVDRDSLLGQTIANQTDPRVQGSVREGGFEVSRGIPNVSSSKPRVEESFAHLAQTPMWFNRQARHVYKTEKAKFGKQAYYAGINHVEFLRKDYTQARDDTLISESLYDLNQVDTNTWDLENPSRIATLVGASSTLTNTGVTVPLLVTYEVDDITHTDEQVEFDYFDQVVGLANQGSTQAINVQVYLMNSDGSRGVLFASGRDYLLNFDVDPDTGLITNSLAIATNSIRLVVNHVTDSYSAATVVGAAVISSTDEYVSRPSGLIDSATVISSAIASEADTAFYLDPPSITAVKVNNAVAVRQGSANPPSDFLDSVNSHTLYPDAKVIGVWAQWSTLNPAKNTFVWPDALDKSIEDALKKGYQLVLRIPSGVCSPSWIYTDSTNPVSSMLTFATDGSAVPVTFPVPWDANLPVHYQNFLNWLATKLDAFNNSGLTVASGITDGGYRRSSAIYFMPVSMPNTLGTEMTIGNGPAPIYLPDVSVTTAATVLGTSLFTDTRQPENGGPTSFTLAGSLTGYPDGVLWLFKIGNELILGTKSGTTVTIHTGGRGFSRSTPAVHSTGDPVFYITSNYYIDTAGTFDADIVNAVYDCQSWNIAQWAAVGTVAQNRARYCAANQSPPSAWENATDMLVQTISMPTGIPASIAYGSAWSDQWANAVDLATVVAGRYPLYLLGMTTNYRPGLGADHNPTNVYQGLAQASLYEGWSPFPARTLRAHSNAGGAIGVQSVAQSWYSQFNNPYDRGSANCAFEDVMEEVFTNFQAFQYLEFSADAFAQGKGNVNSNLDNYYYLVNPANVNNIQQRLINRGVVSVPTGSHITSTGVISSVDAEAIASGIEITFEGGNLNEFASLHNTENVLSAENGFGAFGSWAMLVNRNLAGLVAGGQYGQTTVPVGNKRVAGRAYIDIEQLPDAQAFLFQNVATSANSTIRISPDGTIVGAVVSTSANIVTLPPSGIGANNYYRIEWIYDTSTTTGKLWMRVFDSTGVSLLDSGNPLWDGATSSYLITGTVVVNNITAIRSGNPNSALSVFEARMDRIGLYWSPTQSFPGA